MVSRYGKLTVFPLLLCFGAVVLGDVKPGEPAPALIDLEWVKGGPIDLKKAAGEKMHMVEFWATWCPPCKTSIPLLTDLQKSYSDDLVIIGVTAPDPRNTRDMVKRFVTQQGAKMGYAVAFDRNGKTNLAYGMNKRMGIPHAFLVDKGGQVVWEGSPLDPNLKSIIRRTLEGTWDRTVQEKINKKLLSLDIHLQMGDWKGVCKGLKEVLDLDPASEVAILNLFHAYANELRDREGMREWVESHIKANSSRGDVLHLLAELLCSTSNLFFRYPDLALEASRGAYLHSKESPRASVTATYALALYQVGALDRAIAIQEEALEVAKADKREEIQAILDYYKLCRQLRAGLGD